MHAETQDTQETQQITERVRRYVVDNFLYMRPGFELSNDDQLLGKGIVDSLGVMELITFVEDELGVSVTDSDVTEEHFGSVSAIARYVERALAAR
jgi:acyl carrier protein